MQEFITIVPKSPITLNKSEKMLEKRMTLFLLLTYKISEAKAKSIYKPMKIIALFLFFLIDSGIACLLKSS
jgi:hypothetical protein